jgi:hypothetical protein
VNQTQMVDQLVEQVAKVRNRARPWRSIFALLLATLAMIGSILARQHSRDVHGSLPLELVAAGCAAAFLVFGFGATLGLSGRARDILLPHIGTTHATMVRLLIVLICGLATLVLTLQLLSLPVGQLVLGGALTGVLVGIAAQQTLANLFAGIVLLLSKPFVVGDDVHLWSGPLGGEFDGTVLEVGLTYVRIEGSNGEFRLPNAQVLSAAVGPRATTSPADTAAATGVTATAQSLPTETDPVQADPVQTGQVQTGQVQADRVQTGQVQTGQVQAGQVQAVHVAAQTRDGDAREEPGPR